MQVAPAGDNAVLIELDDLTTRRLEDSAFLSTARPISPSFWSGRH
jgi:hypothetical protein